MGGIVVGVDRSTHAVDALRFAFNEARLRGSELIVVEVWQQPYLSEDVGPDAASSLDEPARRRAEQLLQDQVAKALDGEPAPEGMQALVRAGNPTEVLIRLGRSADLLVVGARGHGGFRHLMTGSVATQLVNHAPCPIRGRASSASTGLTREIRQRCFTGPRRRRQPHLPGALSGVVSTSPYGHGG
jgi:nucleotide-binding universal stress UspA family protein